MPEFVAGLQLARAMYDEIVRPIVDDVQHSAGLLGRGSDVLGFDTDRSTDHGWGPRLHLFVHAGDVADVAGRIDSSLPETFRGWPTRFGWDDTPVSHHVAVTTVTGWITDLLGLDPTSGMGDRDWLSSPQQALLEATSGVVFRDDLNELEPLRRQLTWYPNHVWLWLIACQWRRIGQEDAFVGRAAEVVDELGSRVVAARLCRDLMRLAFLLEQRYAPYTKWLGTAFSRLDSANELEPALNRAAGAGDFQGRQRGLVDAVEAMARRHNALGITDAQEPTVRPFYDRPFLVLGCDRFAQACLDRITDPWLRSLPLVGGVDQFIDSTDALDPTVARRITAVYEPDA